jgi:hypothetical protein
MDIRKALEAGDAGKAVKVMNRLLAAIPYDAYKDAGEKLAGEEPAEGEKAGGEKAVVRVSEPGYRGWLLAFYFGTGMKVEPEATGSQGRSDLVVTTHGGRVWVMELKVFRGISDEAKRIPSGSRYAAERQSSFPCESPGGRRRESTPA